MAVVYNQNELLGTMVVLDNSNHQYKINIYRGNCLAVLVAVDEECHYLYSFYCDESHLKRFIKSMGSPVGDVVEWCRLNMYYKESAVLLKHFVKFFNVECFYQKC